MQERKPIEIAIEASGPLVFDEFDITAKGVNIVKAIYDALPDDLKAECTNDKCFCGTLTLVITETPTFCRVSVAQNGVIE